MAQQQSTLPVRFILREPSGGRYVIEGLLGEGGAGAVYMVSDRRTGQQRFALKEVIDPDSTTTAIRHGSPGYAALEQYGTATTPRTDIYGLGATLYTLLTGIIPPDSITRATASRTCDPLDPPHLIAPEIPGTVAKAIERAIPTPRLTRSLAPPEHMHVRTTAALLPYRQRTSFVRRPRILIFLAIAFLLNLSIGAGLFAAFPRHSHAPAALHRVSIPTPVPPTMTARPPLYPSLAASYAGTVVDLLNNEKTDMFLTQLQQNQGSMHGFFQGLGLAGPFSGTLTRSGHLQFTVEGVTGNETLAFEGYVKIGGDIVGSFVVLDQNGSRTGESGIWNIAVSSMTSTESASPAVGKL